MLLRFLTIIAATSCGSALPTLLSRQVERNSTCDAQKYTQLVGGIEENMFIQKQELQGLQTLQALGTTSHTQTPANGTQSDFQLNQISLAATQQKAIAVRERNQQLADELSSPSAMGLAMVAQTQVAVMLDVQSLTGAEEDKQMLGKLVDRVKSAMSQNEENLKMVDMGCGK
ncbi:hypothetical protein SVAN01_03983 [Stagonosporopsis vannaccii]|nr:hypothetical protein SVAN01_03983 [Stagonosporopsis vannaccii]